MKKLICLLLSLMLMVSSCVVFSATAEEGTTGSDNDFDIEETIDEWLGGFSLDSYELPDFSGYDIDALIASGVLDSVDVGGVSLGFLYNSTDVLPWNSMAIDAGTVYLVMGNLDVYLKNLLYNDFTAEEKYNSANATWLANKIVDIVFGASAPDIAVTLSKTGDKDIFVREVILACRSGFTSLVRYVQETWVDAKVNLWPLIYALGVDLYDVYDKNSAQEVLEETLSAVIEDFLAHPIYSMLDIFWAFARSYKNFMVPPMEAMLSNRIAEGDITPEQLNQPHNLLNLLFNNNNAADTEHLQFLTLPYQRFAVAQDRTECFYYTMVYMMLLGNYGNNNSVFNGYKSSVQAHPQLKQDEKDTICSLINGFVGGDLGSIVTFVQNTFIKNVEGTAKTMLQKLIDRIRQILEDFINSLDKIFGFSARWS